MFELVTLKRGNETERNGTERNGKGRTAMKTAMIVNVFHSNIKDYVLQICIENQSRAARAVLINRASVGIGPFP